MISYCPNCDKPNLSFISQCFWCGFEVSSTEPNRCPECGHGVYLGWKKGCRHVFHGHSLDTGCGCS